jgi:ribosome-associated protein
MQPAIRDYYRLEEIWGDKEIKLGAAKRTSKRTASEEVEEAPKKRSRHLAASQAMADDEPKQPARKTAVKKTAAKKTAAKTPVGKTVKVAASKSTTARKPAAKRATKTKAA